MSLEATTGKIDSNFLSLINSSTIDDIASDGFFEKTVAPWIDNNVEPRMVFEQSTLESWAKSQDVEDVCDGDDLREWAEANGYIREG